ncbi:Uncharacterized protein APZ42_026183 [Daphnia magna]|uniref:HAT C-terminal dimerisation domain-containing protein n=1 Tax=Daphnia magna TaxID=35525 RepID=A0A164SF11_9CRUS|nr:Uncharacterized protein APZ42_026183 [Daphnia magna]
MWKNSCLQMKQQPSVKEGSNVSTGIPIRSEMMTQTDLNDMVLVPPPTSPTTTTTYNSQMTTTMKKWFTSKLGDILDKRPSATKSTGSPQITLPVHRRCACHLLNLVSKADVDKIADILFTELRSNVEEKLKMLWNKHSSSSNHSDTIHRHLGQLVMRKKGKSLRKLLDDFKIPFFTPSEEQYMKEYTKIMKSVVEALEILQGDKNVGLGYLLPTITVLKSNLSLLQDDSSIFHCQPLISGILDAIDSNSIISPPTDPTDSITCLTIKKLWLVAISNPMYKTSWLEDDADVRKALSLIRCEFQRHKDYVNGDSDISNGSSNETSSSKSEHCPAKRSKHPKNFFAKFVKRNPKNKVDEVDMFLKDCSSIIHIEYKYIPCSLHIEAKLVNYPTILKIYKRFNAALPSSASLERLFSQGGLILTPKRSSLSDPYFEMLLFLKVNHPAFTVC